MSWFKKRQPEPPRPPPPFKVGQRFRYLGLTMVCVNNSQMHFWNDCVVADYFNIRKGRVERMIFYPANFDALIAENNR